MSSKGWIDVFQQSMQTHLIYNMSASTSQEQFMEAHHLNNFFVITTKIKLKKGGGCKADIFQCFLKRGSTWQFMLSLSLILCNYIWAGQPITSVSLSQAVGNQHNSGAVHLAGYYSWLPAFNLFLDFANFCNSLVENTLNTFLFCFYIGHCLENQSEVFSRSLN